MVRQEKVYRRMRRSNSEGMHALEKAIEGKQRINEEERKAKAEERQQQWGISATAGGNPTATNCSV